MTQTSFSVRSWPVWRALVVLSAVVCLAACGSSGGEAGPFYSGKTVSIVVGSGAGGGFDTTARLVSRHIGKHIPGAPVVIVQNMPGGGGLVAANHVFSAAPKDGTVIGLFHEAQMMNQLTGGEGVQFDLGQFNWLGSSYVDPNVCIVRTDAPATTFTQMIERSTPICGGRDRSGIEYLRRTARARGGNRRAPQGGCGIPDDQRCAHRRRAWRAPGHVPRLGVGPVGVGAVARRHATPWCSSRTARRGTGTCRTCRSRWSSPRTTTAGCCCASWTRLAPWPSRSRSRPASIPSRVQEMRSALAATYRDAAFLEEARAMQLDFQPKDAAGIQQVLDEVLATPPHIAAKYRQIIQP